MSRDELPQYTPNIAVMSFETPRRQLHPLWTTPDANPGTPTIIGTGFQSYPAYLATPSSQSHQTSVKRSHKRKSDENSGQSILKKARNSRSLGLLSDSTMLNLPSEMGMPDEVSDPDADKLNCFFAFLQDTLKWTFGELLYHASKGKSPGVKRKLGPDGNSLVTSNLKEVKWNSSIIQHFMHGRGTYGPADILNNWMQHPYGADERQSHLMYSTTVPYLEIRPVRPALTAFAAQTVKAKIIHEAESAVKLSSGLHVAVTRKQQKKSLEMRLDWPDIGAATFDKVQGIIQEKQPLTWSLIMEVASQPPRVQNSIKIICQKRPPQIIATHIISTLNFSWSSSANLLPLATGLLYFASSASYDLFRHHAHVGDMPAYSMIMKAMCVLSECEVEKTLQHGADVDSIGVIRLDNVQNYLIQRNPAIGHENKLNIGLSATYYEVEGIDPHVFDLSEKYERLAENKRKDLTVNNFVSLVDSQHLETVGILQWINTLVQHIPELSFMKKHVSMLYRTRAAKQRLPPKQTKVHPLALSSRNETVVTDLKEALLDFLAQTGQMAESFKKHLFPIGGDGLTFNKILDIQDFLQFHKNEFETLRVLDPLLEWWHSLWTDLSRLFGSHWGGDLSKDPSTLSHSATKIRRKKPSNLKKVDYFQHSQLAYLVLDARMLDCWR